jgi:hypothetical protein
MRQLLKLALSAAVVALVVVFVRRLLDHGDTEAEDSQPGDTALTRDELYREAARLDIRGRSKMNKRELQRAVEDATSAGPA